MAGVCVTLCLVLFILVLGLVRSAGSSSHDYQREQDPTYWHNVAQAELDTTLKPPTRGVAKNVILFLGDGMGPTTVTAARILAGQKRGQKGEEYKLSFDEFPHTGLSRTYNVDSQVTDSAASGTAYLTGVKTRQGMLGLSAAAYRGNCSSSTGAHVDSILRWSAQAGKSTGVVTTARITHATPAAAYAHCPDREWESDRLVPETEKACEDIALQLVTRNSDINVLMGGGRANFYPENFTDPAPDPAYPTEKVSRMDNRNLVQEWVSDKQRKRSKHRFVYDKPGLESVDVLNTDYLLGLFNQNHMSYELDRNATSEPSIADMTEKAIKILKRNTKGFFLLVEGGRIDHGHHDSTPSQALHDTIAMAEAVGVATKLTDSSDTLIVVTADHSHVMSVAGYAIRGNPILGISSDLNMSANVKTPLDNMPYTTILYANGPGYTQPRQNLTNLDTEVKNYVSQSGVPMSQETHGGEDVAIYASGPQSFLYGGVHEQNYIPMVMAYASCVGPYAEGQKPCAANDKAQTVQELPTSHNTDGDKSSRNTAFVLSSTHAVIVLCSLLVLLEAWNRL